MPIPTWVPGQVLSASDVNSWFVPLAALKTGDTARTSTTTLAADPDLVIAVPATTTWRFEMSGVYTAAGGPGDLKWDFTAPAGASILYNCLHNEGGATGLNNSHLVNNLAFSPGFAAGSGSSTNTALAMWGYFSVAGTAGNLTFRWAQNTSSGTATTMRAGSLMTLRRIG